MTSTLAARLRAAYAQSLMTDSLICQYNDTYEGHVDALPRTDPEEYKIKPLPSTKRPASAISDSDSIKKKPKLKICIVGAGAAGLHTALALQYCQSLDLQIDILEASDRPGGRMYTHTFENGGDTDHNYVDIGAMRIPEIERMDTTFNLIKRELQMEHVLKEYTYDFDDDVAPQPPNCWWFGGESPSETKFKEVMEALLKDLGILDNFEAGKTKFQQQNLDKHSTRSWLMSNFGLKKEDPEKGVSVENAPVSPNFNYEETVEAEGATTSTGLFDQALFETVCDYLDFHPDIGRESVQGETKKIGWKRVEGGMKVIVDAMVKKVEQHDHTPANITYGCSVIAYKHEKGSKTITVKTQQKSNGKCKELVYDAVFNTTALPCLQRMDISGLKLDKTVLTGIRTLAYDRATKVAIKFNKPWWRKHLNVPGGVSSSDLPISKTVYPSWTFREAESGEEAESAVLIASYSWAQDATRMGALFHNSQPGDKPNRDHPVVTLCLRNLERLWSMSGMENPPTFDELREMYEDHFAYAWSHDEHQGGAYAMFAPGQFGSIYPAFFQTHCDGTFVMCGEALSVQHAWIAGAIDSSYNSVQSWLCYHEFLKAQRELKASPLGGGPDKHTLEFNEKLCYWAAKLSCGVKEHEGLGHTEKHVEEKHGNTDIKVAEISPVT